MPSGAIDVADLAGGIDLQATLESGQSYLWHREDGRDYDDGPADGWYWTTVRVDGNPEVIRVRHRDGRLEWDGTLDAASHLRRRLRLGDDLPAIRETAPEDRIVQDAYDAHWGLRLVEDPPFGALVSFVCSTQMRVARIHGMQATLREALGESLDYDGRTYHAYPTPERLARTSEARLRELGLGYRAPYVRDSAEMVATGEADPATARDMAYPEAREFLTRFVGVGPKVADCVCLFSLGFLEAIPLDTWMQHTVAEYYPDCERGEYEETTDALREALGGAYAGYAQTYLFHYLRTGGDG